MVMAQCLVELDCVDDNVKQESDGFGRHHPEGQNGIVSGIVTSVTHRGRPRAVRLAAKG